MPEFIAPFSRGRLRSAIANRGTPVRIIPEASAVATRRR